jgi:hypothetical protein
LTVACNHFAEDFEPQSNNFTPVQLTEGNLQAAKDKGFMSKKWTGGHNEECEYCSDVKEGEWLVCCDHCNTAYHTGCVKQQCSQNTWCINTSMMDAAGKPWCCPDCWLLEACGGDWGASAAPVAEGNVCRQAVPFAQVSL